MLFKLASLFISSLHKLDDEANKFYDRKHDLYEAALHTRCYTQHALRPYIDSEIYHTRHFIKLPFITKGIEFIDLPSIFQDNNDISSIPSYFENPVPPIICYKYNKPIRNTILNFNKLVFYLDIENSPPPTPPPPPHTHTHTPPSTPILEIVKILNFVIKQRVILLLVI